MYYLKCIWNTSPSVDLWGLFWESVETNGRLLVEECRVCMYIISCSAIRLLAVVTLLMYIGYNIISHLFHEVCRMMVWHHQPEPNS